MERKYEGNRWHGQEDFNKVRDLPILYALNESIDAIEACQW
jgi:hypothetical protein